MNKLFKRYHTKSFWFIGLVFLSIQAFSFERLYVIPTLTETFSYVCIFFFAYWAVLEIVRILHQELKAQSSMIRLIAFSCIYSFILLSSFISHLAFEAVVENSDSYINYFKSQCDEIASKKCDLVARLAENRKDYQTAFEYSVKYCNVNHLGCNNAAYTLTKMKDISKEQKAIAVILIQKALEADKNNKGRYPVYLDTYAAVLAMNGKFDEAAKEQTKAIEFIKTNWPEEKSKYSLPRYEAVLKVYQSRMPASNR